MNLAPIIEHTLPAMWTMNYNVTLHAKPGLIHLPRLDDHDQAYDKDWPIVAPHEAINLQAAQLKATPPEVGAIYHSTSFGFTLWMLLLSGAVIYLFVMNILKGPMQQLGYSARVALGGIGSANYIPHATASEIACDRVIIITTVVTIANNVLVLVGIAAVALYLACKLQKRKRKCMKLKQDNVELENRNKMLSAEVLGKLLHTPQDARLSHPPLYPSLTA